MTFYALNDYNAQILFIYENSILEKKRLQIEKSYKKFLLLESCPKYSNIVTTLMSRFSNLTYSLSLISKIAL